MNKTRQTRAKIVRPDGDLVVKRDSVVNSFESFIREVETVLE